jgi:hypothetical protein
MTSLSRAPPSPGDGHDLTGERCEAKPKSYYRARSVAFSFMPRQAYGKGSARAATS